MKRIIATTVFTIILTFIGHAQQKKTHRVRSLKDSVESINLKARDYRNAGKYDSAFILSKQALRLSEDNLNYSGMASALNIIGSTYEFVGKYDSAILMNNKALKICHENKLDSIKAIVCNSLGTAYKRVGKYGNSIDAYYIALKIEEKNSNSAGIWRVLGNLTSLYKDLGDYEKSVQTGLRSIQYAKNDSAKLLRSYINIGTAYFGLKNVTKAIEYTLKALEISTITKSKDHEIICNINLCEYYISIKRIDKALYYIKRAYTESMAISSRPRILSSSINFAALMVETRKYDSALFFINKANSMIKFSYDKQKKVELNELKAKVYAGKSNFKLAYQYADSARLLTAELKNEDVVKAINNSISSYEVIKKENEIQRIEAEKRITEIEVAGQKKVIFSLIIFSIVVVLAILVLIYLLKRIKKADKIIRETNEMLKTKNEIIEMANAELTEKTMRNQLNPHFIFNCLNTLHYLLLKNNSEDAQLYLSKFSYLLRRILESTDRPSVSVAEEIEIIQIYVKLESLRFDDSINLLIDAESFDPEDVYIPPLLTQPILENAIHHGLSPKIGEKNIFIRFTLENNSLKCSITDNGVGRGHKKAATFGSKRESKGVKLTATRLASFNQHIKEHAIVTTDLLDENNKPCGTRVEFELTV